MTGFTLSGLDGKVAVIPGGATRIGAAIAQDFIKAGCAVAILDISAEATAHLAQELGPRCLGLCCDITQDDAVEAAIHSVAQHFGRIDFLVNVACSYQDDGVNTDPAAWLSALNVTIVGGIRVLRAVRPHMAKVGGGAIVNIGSTSGKVAQAGRWVYPAGKAAVLQITRSAALDLAAEGIRVNSVSPGWTWSNVLDALSGHNRPLVDKIASPFHILGRAGDAGEVAHAVLFLCSSEASFITGADLPVDGGYTAIGPEQTGAAIGALLAAQGEGGQG